MSEPIRVVIADDDPFVGASLKTILEARGCVEVAAVGASGEEAVALYDRLRPDVLLLDIRMPGMGGLGAAERVLAAHPDARVVFLTTFSDDDYIVRALRLGARGYLVKQDVGTIPDALRAVVAGQSVFGPEVCERLDLLVGRGSEGLRDAPGENAGRAGGERGETRRCGAPRRGRCAGLPRRAHRARARHRRARRRGAGQPRGGGDALPVRGHRAQPHLRYAPEARPAQPHPARPSLVARSRLSRETENRSPLHRLKHGNDLGE